MVTPDHCTVCNKSFKRLLHHLNQSLACKSHYMASDKAATTVPSIVSNIGHVKTGNLLQGGTSRTFRPNLSSPLSDGLLPVLESGGIAGKADDELRVEDVNEVDDYIMFEDDGIPEQGDADDQDISETESEEGPDLSVLDLYLKLFKLRANPLGLARFSREERVQIELLQLLRDLKCPLKAFTLVLKWAAKSNGSGHSFREGFQPTRENGPDDSRTLHTEAGTKPLPCRNNPSQGQHLLVFGDRT
ncbi:hypothetical protein MHU86_11305 [Fragilaria crotonensis]|nr:hypothetical protein MHU86_11305 [Fragilaria crotonensis]